LFGELNLDLQVFVSDISVITSQQANQIFARYKPFKEIIIYYIEEVK